MYGINGAALATFISFAIQAVRMIYVYKKLEFYPFIRKQQLLFDDNSYYFGLNFISNFGGFANIVIRILSSL